MIDGVSAIYTKRIIKLFFLRSMIIFVFSFFILEMWVGRASASGGFDDIGEINWGHALTKYDNEAACDLSQNWAKDFSIDIGDVIKNGKLFKKYKSSAHGDYFKYEKDNFEIFFQRQNERSISLYSAELSGQLNKSRSDYKKYYVDILKLNEESAKFDEIVVTCYNTALDIKFNGEVLDKLIIRTIEDQE